MQIEACDFEGKRAARKATASRYASNSFASIYTFIYSVYSVCVTCSNGIVMRRAFPDASVERAKLPMVQGLLKVDEAQSD